jgi:hypothetical protein
MPSPISTDSNALPSVDYQCVTIWMNALMDFYAQRGMAFFDHGS